jgi:hypothetical protein
VATPAAAVTVTNTTAAAPDKPAPIAKDASTDSSHTMPPETPPMRVATASTSVPLPNDTKNAVSSIEGPDECREAEVCIDQYLWALYQRTPKEDTIKVNEQRKVAVKKKGKTVTVTRSFTRLVDEDFTWKDPKADVVSVKGETRDQRYGSSENLWRWIDAHGEEFGIGRPYLDKDPAHVAPIDGKEYAAHHRGTKVRHAGSEKRSRSAEPNNHNDGKRSKTAKSL